VRPGGAREVVEMDVWSGAMMEGVVDVILDEEELLERAVTGMEGVVEVILGKEELLVDDAVTGVVPVTEEVIVLLMEEEVYPSLRKY
jgi:hypothetical protein